MRIWFSIWSSRTTMSDADICAAAGVAIAQASAIRRTELRLRGMEIWPKLQWRCHSIGRACVQIVTAALSGNGALRAPLLELNQARVSRTRIEHGDGAPVLRPAGNIVANRDLAFLAVGDRAH